MPAAIVPDTMIPELSAQIDSPSMFRVLRLVKQRGFIQNSTEVNEETAAILKRLVELDLVNPGYAGPTDGEPFIWVSNHNGERVLKHFEENQRHQVKVHPPARTALGSLSETDRVAV